MSSKKVFVGGLAWATDSESLKKAFERFGTVEDAKVIMDRETGRSRGFGFVTFSDELAASTAVEEQDGQLLDGRTVKVSEAQSTPSRPSNNRR